MSDETTEQAEGEAGGEEETPSRLSGGCVVAILAGIAVLVLKAIVSTAPYTAYFVAGVLACLAWQKVRAWLGNRRGGSAEGDQEEAQPDIGEALRVLVGNDNGVLLTRLQRYLNVANTKAVKQLLDDAGVTWKAVRTSHGNGPGVHKNDIPPDPSTFATDVHGDGCCCRSGDNANSNNSDGGDGQKGLRVEPIGQAGSLVHDPADTVRRHRVK